MEEYKCQLCDELMSAEEIAEHKKMGWDLEYCYCDACNADIVSGYMGHQNVGDQGFI
jgi:hypothetical protein